MAGLIASGIGIVDGDDFWIVEQGYKGVKSEVMGGAAEGGEVGEIVGFLPGEHAVPFAFGEDEGIVAGPEIGAEEGGFRAAHGNEFWLDGSRGTAVALLQLGRIDLQSILLG